MARDEDIEETRRSQRVAEAVRARKFSAIDTLTMGFALIDFALRFRKEADDALNG